MSLKICIVSEALNSPFDEGVKIFVFNFIKELSKKFDVLAIGRSNNIIGEIQKIYLNALPKNKLLISFYLRRQIKAFNPDIIYYFPPAQATIYSFLRTRILKFYGKGILTILITLQPRQYSARIKKIIPFIIPDLILAQSVKTLEILRSLGCNVRKIPSGVDLQKFTPVDKVTKKNLRKKYSINNDKCIVLHVGHINRNRNMQFFEQIQYIEGVQGIIIGSSTYPEDDDLVDFLKKKGVTIIMGHLENIEELYQCADCYLFPVFSESACIEVPLSIFEAMACNLPVITTKYGDLPNLIQEQDGFMYAEDPEEIKIKIKDLKWNYDPRTRKLVEHYSWTNVVKYALEDSLIM